MTIIRSLTKDDPIQDLIALSNQFFQEYQANHRDFFGIKNLTPDHIRAYFSRFYQDSEDAAAFIAIEEGKIVGNITVYVKTQAEYWKVNKIGVISGFMVEKAYRRMGIGSQLFDRAKLFFLEKRITYFTVYTAVSNYGALAFYDSNGMEPLQTTFLGKIVLPVEG